VALYLDTSCLAKLLFDEPESPRTAALIAGEARVAVSSLARLEAAAQIQGRVAGGGLTARQGKQLLEQLAGLITRQPLEPVAEPADVFDVAEKQVRGAPKAAYCPTLDRLHLAVMEALGFTRLLTNDEAQARAARALGFEVILPR
jgi:predicted nucleic acid-binding protein